MLTLTLRRSTRKTSLTHVCALEKRVIGYNGSLGWGFPAALGAKVANPDRVVVSVNGDGGFLFQCSDLATAAQFDIALIVCVFNNGAYGNVKRDQKLNYSGHSIGVDLTNPDFLLLAKAFGVDGYKANDAEEFRVALKEAVGKGRPALIDIDLAPGCETSAWAVIAQSPITPGHSCAIFPSN